MKVLYQNDVPVLSAGTHQPMLLHSQFTFGAAESWRDVFLMKPVEKWWRVGRADYGQYTRRTPYNVFSSNFYYANNILTDAEQQAQYPDATSRDFELKSYAVLKPTLPADMQRRDGYIALAVLCAGTQERTLAALPHLSLAQLQCVQTLLQEAQFNQMQHTLQQLGHGRKPKRFHFEYDAVLNQVAHNLKAIAETKTEAVVASPGAGKTKPIAGYPVVAFRAVVDATREPPTDPQQSSSKDPAYPLLGRPNKSIHTLQ